MKVIAFILSAYLLLLFAIPCCAFDNCPEEKEKQEANHQKGDGDCGNCSPFFTCTGCTGFTVSVTEIGAGVGLFFSCNQYHDYIVSSIPDISYDFWQPPKLVS